ncbi:MAG: hypothetical protein ACRC8Y_23015 [Chroococcales cyanobacterium]
MADAITGEQRLKSLLQTRRNNFSRDTKYLPHLSHPPHPPPSTKDK